MCSMVNDIAECMQVGFSLRSILLIQIKICSFQSHLLYVDIFQTVGDFLLYDHTHQRSYRSKVLLYDKSIIYTEVKAENKLVIIGRYTSECIGISPNVKNKFFTLYYRKRQQQECDFHAEQPQIERWIALITSMIREYAHLEKLKLKERFVNRSTSDSAKYSLDCDIKIEIRDDNNNNNMREKR